MSTQSNLYKFQWVPGSLYAESIEKLIKNMNECNPDVLTAVPRFYQNLYQKINTNFNKTSA